MFALFALAAMAKSFSLLVSFPLIYCLSRWTPLTIGQPASPNDSTLGNMSLILADYTLNLLGSSHTFLLGCQSPVLLKGNLLNWSPPVLVVDAVIIMTILMD